MERREPDLCLVPLAPYAKGGVLALDGDDDATTIEADIRRTPPDALVAFDLRGLRYVGYSYFKATVRRLLKKRLEGDLGGRRLFLVAKLDPAFLDGAERALAEENLVMYTFEKPEDFGRRGQLVGAKSRGNQDRAGNVLDPSLGVLLKRRAVTTGEAAALLDTTPQNMKNRFDRLADVGVIVREKVTSSTGGYEWRNAIW